MNQVFDFWATVGDGSHLASDIAKANSYKEGTILRIEPSTSDKGPMRVHMSAALGALSEAVGPDGVVFFEMLANQGDSFLSKRDRIKVIDNNVVTITPLSAGMKILHHDAMLNHSSYRFLAVGLKKMPLDNHFDMLDVCSVCFGDADGYRYHVWTRQ